MIYYHYKKKNDSIKSQKHKEVIKKYKSKKKILKTQNLLKRALGTPGS